MRLRLLKTLDRYVLSQLMSSIAFGVGLFTILFISTSLIFQTLKLVVNYKVGWGLALRFFLLSLPQVIAYTIPMGVLLGVMNTFGQMSSNFELVAFRTHGISFRRVMAPAIAVAIVLSLANAWFYSFVVPHALRGARDILLKAHRQLSGAVINSPNMTVRLSDGTIRKIVAGHWDPGTMTLYNLTVSDWRDGIPLRVTFAEQARYDPGEGDWVLKEVTSFELAGRGRELSLKVRTDLKEMRMRLVEPSAITRQRRLDEYDLGELLSEVKLISQMGGEAREMLVEIHSRLAIPMASLVFATFAAPLSTQPVRSSSLVGAGLSLLVILLYYIVFYFGKSLSLGGTVPPAVGVWLANVIFSAIGLSLAFRER